MADIQAEVRLKTSQQKYVGRGGLKLEKALEEFQISASGAVCLDVGSSTGGFTDSLLQSGAKKVYAVDVGYGQLAWKLRKDPKVVVLERRNIRHLPKDAISEPIDLLVIDVSFISLKTVFPAVEPFLADTSKIIALIKPQFEVKPSEVGPKGVVQDSALHDRSVEEIKKAGTDLGWTFVGVIPSPILGAEGNKEFLIYFQR